MAGRLEKIWIKRFRQGPMDEVESAELVAGDGIVGNTNRGGRRQVTILSSEAWGDVEEEIGTCLDPALRRANLMVSGVDLEESRGKVLVVGEAAIEIGGETRPCPHMDEAYPGLMGALDPQWRGGAHGRVVVGGRVEASDTVGWREGATGQAVAVSATGSVTE